MSSQLAAVIAGGAIGIMGSMGATYLIVWLTNRRRTKSIRGIVLAETIAIKEKAERYINGQSSINELAASSPMYVSLAPELGLLSPEQVTSFRRSVTMDMELRNHPSQDKARAVVKACEGALRSLR
ncbi:MAG: hypothetical protein QF898_02175 [SAR202 cluster bacterium]|jgi:hypothetical protein|nr:hypothetical protein [SAR202 cluster bacterium]MDP6513240.1 hypothetical protein [SAR202 cluster bacterium]MDP6716304.1 hypothetical protein [SAR202 cluster bacterium]